MQEKLRIYHKSAYFSYDILQVPYCLNEAKDVEYASHCGSI